jgi:hypothetical protein
MDNRTIAYVSRGKLHIKSGGDAAREIESKFGESVRNRAAAIERKSAWKTKGSGAQFGSGGLLWGQTDPEPTAIRIAVAGLTRGRAPGELLYALETSTVSGVFAFDAESNVEDRLFHSADHRVQHLHARAGHDLVACNVHHDNGTANIAVMQSDGSDLTIVTEGDSVDVAPRWVPGQDRQIVYQSAGLGRTAEGARGGVGPFSIQKIDLRKGELETLAEDPRFDFLGPQIGGDGALYYIKRPYSGAPGGEASVSIVRTLLDAILFPFRLLVALFQFLNFFTIRYTGKPLASSGGARQKSADMKRMLVWGNVIDAERNAARGGDDDTPSIVPSTWQLCRQSGGETKVIAKGVVSFDLDDAGGLVFSNGSAVYAIDAAGKKTRVCTADQIEHVVLLA